MKRLILLISLCLSLFLFAGCGSDEATETAPKDDASAVGSMTDEAGGPFSESEYAKFLKDIPEITKITNPALNAGKEVKPEDVTKMVLNAAKELNWKEERFMYVYSQAMTVLSLEQLKQMESQMAASMDGLPEEQKKQMMASMTEQMGGQMESLKKQVDGQVPVSEQEIILSNIGNLYKALGIQQ